MSDSLRALPSDGFVVVELLPLLSVGLSVALLLLLLLSIVSGLRGLMVGDVLLLLLDRERERERCSGLETRLPLNAGVAMSGRHTLVVSLCKIVLGSLVLCCVVLSCLFPPLRFLPGVLCWILLVLWW